MTEHGRQRRITPSLLMQALLNSECDKSPEDKATVVVVSATEVRITGAVDVVEWADALNEMCFPPLRAVATEPQDVGKPAD